MSLRIWAPLAGDLRQIGASNAVLTNDGATVDNSGKIGKCYSFANTHIIVDSTDIQSILSSTTQPFSMACWIYLNSDETDRVIIFGNYDANPFVNWELAANCTQRLCAGGTSNYTNRANGTVVPKTTWTHIAVTYNGATTTFYQNGVSVGSVDGANTLTTKTASSRFYLGSDTRTGATRLKGKMNDFRFYDHCLSAAEVHEIAQGLVVHYKLDDLTNGVIDSSGYGHNGTIYGTATITSESPRYNAAIVLNSTSSHIRVTGLATTGFTNSYSFVWWANSNSTTNMHWGFKDGTRVNGLFNGNLWNTGDSSNNPLYKPGTTTQVTVTEANVWHHWAMTGDGSACKVYKDGVHVATAKTVKGLGGTELWFNGWQNSTSYTASNLELSDFRLYCTALSAADILSLYHTGARMDNLNNLHTFSFEEQIEEGDDYSNISLFNGGSYDETTTGSAWIISYSTAISPAPTSRSVTINANKYSYIYTTKFPLNNYGSYKITIPTCEIRPYSYNYTSSYWQRSGSRYTRVSRGTIYGKYGYIYVYLVLYNSNYEELGSKRIKTAGYTVTSSSQSSLSSNPITLYRSTYNFTLPYDLTQYDDIAYGSLKVEMAGTSPDVGTEFSVVQTSLISSIVTPQLLKTGVFINKQIHEKTTDKIQFLFDGTFNIEQAIEV